MSERVPGVIEVSNPRSGVGDRKGTIAEVVGSLGVPHRIRRIARARSPIEGVVAERDGVAAATAVGDQV